MTDEHEFLSTRGEQLARRLRAEHALSRRDLLKLGVAGAMLLGTGPLGHAGRAWAQAPAAPIVKPLPPEWFVTLGTNAEMRWEAMRGQGYVTPVERFFVRNHTATPSIDAATWRLRIHGRGLRDAQGIELSYDHLRRLPASVVTAFVECAGNGRSFFAGQQGTPASGTQWKLGAIGVAHWRGVLLSEVLERAGHHAGRRRRLPVGPGRARRGRRRRPGTRPTAAPGAKALEDVLLAYEMNGEPLPPDHGFPVRLRRARLDRHRQHQVAGRDRGLRRSRCSPRGTPRSTA